MGARRVWLFAVLALAASCLLADAIRVDPDLTVRGTRKQLHQRFDKKKEPVVKEVEKILESVKLDDAVEETPEPTPEPELEEKEEEERRGHSFSSDGARKRPHSAGPRGRERSAEAREFDSRQGIDREVKLCSKESKEGSRCGSTPTLPGRCVTTESIDDQNTSHVHYRCINGIHYDLLEVLREQKQGVWTKIDPQELYRDTAEKLYVSGQNMKQNSRDICGPMSVVHALINTNAALYIKLVTELYLKGEGKVEIKGAEGELHTYTIQPRPYLLELDPRKWVSYLASNKNANPQLADWILTASLRDDRTNRELKSLDSKTQERIEDDLSLIKSSPNRFGVDVDSLTTSNDIQFWCDKLFRYKCQVVSEDNGDHLTFLEDVTPSALFGILSGAKAALESQMRAPRDLEAAIQAGKTAAGEALEAATPAFREFVESKFNAPFLGALHQFARKASDERLESACTNSRGGGMILAQVNTNAFKRGILAGRISMLKATIAHYDSEAHGSWNPKLVEKRAEVRAAKVEELKEAEEEMSEWEDDPVCPSEGNLCVGDHWVQITYCGDAESRGEESGLLDYYSVWSWGKTYRIPHAGVRNMTVVMVVGSKQNPRKSRQGLKAHEV